MLLLLLRVQALVKLIKLLEVPTVHSSVPELVIELLQECDMFFLGLLSLIELGDPTTSFVVSTESQISKTHVLCCYLKILWILSSVLVILNDLKHGDAKGEDKGLDHKDRELVAPED